MPWTIEAFLTSDALISCLILVSLSILSLKIFPNIHTSSSSILDVSSILAQPFRAKSSHPAFSLERATAAYARYEDLARSDIRRMRKSYDRMGRAHKRIGYDLGYTRKLSRLSDVTAINAEATAAIARFARSRFAPCVANVSLDGGDLSRVRESLRHFVRDWSEDGREERSRIFGPMLDVLQLVDRKERDTLKVLVPGCGFGRLAWEIAQLGFDTTANELSSFMNLALHFLLSPETTQDRLQHTIHPHAHWFSHQRNNASLFRPIAFPDVVPRISTHFRLIENDFLKLSRGKKLDTFEHGERRTDGYDYVVTLFFIDTSLNIISTLEKIFDLLRPGGTWINLGPLLWTGGAQAALELSLDELLKLAEIVGFVVEESSRKTVDCEYTSDSHAMMKWMYMAEFWIARKPK